MKRFTFYLALSFFLISIHSFAQNKQSLDGIWRFSLDDQNKGINERWFDRDLTQSIYLPGTTDEAKYGTKTVGSDFGILTRAYKYYGPAWYQKDLIVPQGWKGKQLFLNLERVMWQSMLFVDGKHISTLDALNAPHTHPIGVLSPGKHRLTIRINNDMIYNIGDKGHVYSEYTQSIWNGAVGKIELLAKFPVRLSNPQIFTSISPKTLQIKDTLVNDGAQHKTVILAISLRERKTGMEVFSEKRKLILKGAKQALDLTEQVPESVALWDDINPNLYTLSLSVIGDKDVQLDRKEMEVGFREISTARSKILVNGKPVFFRGNLDCVHFPLTGYPAMDVESWERIFRIYKSYGLNHVRFHSWCPPEAAFTAADRIGLYLHPEVIWLDWWMAVDNPGREEMNTKGRPQGLGHNVSADIFAQKEIATMLSTYGNHASFTTMSIGNELGNSDFDVMESWLKPYKKNDSRHLYSVSSARKITALDQFIATHYMDKLGGTRGLRGATTDWDFESVYSQSSIPVIAHEIGQWPVYPRWDEIKKYTGVLKARNLEQFREQAKKNNLEAQNEAFVQASGALNQLMYKNEIESFLRTPSAAGIQLLSMQDYQGQGEALIGWLDAFYDSKGITTPEQFRMHNDTTVTLLRIPKFVWNSKEVFKAKVQVAHYGKADIQDGVYWKIYDDEQRVISTGNMESSLFQSGTSKIIGNFESDFSQIERATKLTVEVGLKNRPIKNRWEIWVYPTAQNKKAYNIYMADRFDAKVEAILQSGGNVLLDASDLGNVKTADNIAFYPLYWSLTFFPGQGINTIGMLVRDKHPAFANFPTDSYSSWQWQYIYKNAKGFYINDFPASYRPLAQPIDDFHRNNKLASIFELKVGKGKLLVTGFNIRDDKNLVANQLRASLEQYMISDAFNPDVERNIDSLRKMFAFVEPLKSVAPKAFKNSLLYVEAGKKSQRINENAAWATDLDLNEASKGTTYSVKADGVWKDDVSSAWQGKQVEINLRVPQGMIGTFYVFFHDWNDLGRAADIEFEGREYTLGPHNKDGKWVKLHVMREDSNDGVLKLKVSGTKGPNIMIGKIALTEEVD